MSLYCAYNHIHVSSARTGGNDAHDGAGAVADEGLHALVHLRRKRRAHTHTHTGRRRFTSPLSGRWRRRLWKENGSETFGSRIFHVVVL